MTVPCTDTKQLVAELLFVLCKEKVGRLIKYTGYGNAAGLLARRGLLRATGVLYSSDSEDSDTEEYLKHRDHINPVLGCHEPVREPPLQAMSEEQKEHEAMKLVNLMDQLTSGVTSVLFPCLVAMRGRAAVVTEAQAGTLKGIRAVRAAGYPWHNADGESRLMGPKRAAVA
ncbi:hypothetical protein HPB51_020381 [Rhipicephalus microplus]|uniref:Uncharacterized protein n=1 Tax=Rhipicephalus microplus TaxID=6941 RepID=A0A9J6DW53_RHIMP|nr:hypothetical protein HPB51_020381 [Rhipicephalus microplus]